MSSFFLAMLYHTLAFVGQTRSPEVKREVSSLQFELRAAERRTKMMRKRGRQILSALLANPRCKKWKIIIKLTQQNPTWHLNFIFCHPRTTTMAEPATERYRARSATTNPTVTNRFVERRKGSIRRARDQTKTILKNVGHEMKRKLLSLQPLTLLRKRL